MAQDDAIEKRLITVRSIDDEAACAPQKAPCWDLPLIPVRAGDEVEIHVDLTSGFHDLTFLTEGFTDVKTPSPSQGTHVLQLTIPAGTKNAIEFECTIHPDTMKGKLAPPEAFKIGDEVDVVHLGVHFLAYWVGVIAFALLFIVYGATFFIFKYNETTATTDHKDRPDAAALKGKLESRSAILLSLVVAAVLVAAIVFLRG